MELYEKLTQARKAARLTQADVAAGLDVSRQAVSRWESGQSKPSTEKLLAPAKIYDVSLDWLCSEAADGNLYEAVKSAEDDGTNNAMVECPNALCKDEYELSWEGTYEYFDLTTGAVRAIRDPNTFYIAATSVGLTDQSNYTTTINGKSIPNAQYPAGGTYSGSTSTSFGTGSQCHGFGLYIYDYLFGSSGAKCSQGFEYIGNYTQTQIKNKLQSFALGTLLRVSYSGSTSDEHTMILVGRDSTGVIIYHANWPDNGTVAISHVTWSGFAQTFPYLDFIICPHNVNVWKPYSSTQHRGACTACGTYLYGSHYAQVGGMGTCLVCGYYGNMPGLTSTGHETE